MGACSSSVIVTGFPPFEQCFCSPWGGAAQLWRAPPRPGVHVEEADWEFLTEEVLESAEDASRSYLLAAYVAQYGEILSQSFWARDESLEALTLMSEDLPGLFPGDLRVQEFEEVVHAAWAILGE